MDRTAAPQPGHLPVPVPVPRQTVRADAAMAAVILLLGIFLAATGSFLVQRWQSARRASSRCPSRTSWGSRQIPPD